MQPEIVALEFDLEVLAALGPDVADVLRLDPRSAELFDALALGGLVSPPPAVSQNLRGVARARSGRRTTDWRVS